VIEIFIKGWKYVEFNLYKVQKERKILLYFGMIKVLESTRV